MPPVSLAPLVGRDAELEDLVLRLGIRASERSRGGIVLLAGDAGVGKTRLLTTLRDEAVGAGWQVVAGHCLDFADSALPYLPFSEVLGRLQVDQPEVVAAVAVHHPALLRLQPGRRMIDEGDDGAATIDKGALFAAVHALVEAVAEARPLVLVVEDLHWADQSTRDLMSFLFTRPFSGPVALVASYRSDDLHRKHPLRGQVAEWSRLQGVGRMSLEPLAAAEVRALVAGLQAGLSDDEVDVVVERADGNAFFVEELVGATSGSRASGGGLPADLAELLLVRLDRLEPTARGAVRAASVAGRRVTHELLSVAADLDPAALDAGLRAAVEGNILVASDRHYAFRHALLGEAVYDDLLPGERVRLHGRYAQAIRDGEARGSAAELARHALLAHDDATALTASIQAGHEAAAVGGPDEAGQHFQRALELLCHPTRAPGVAVDLAALSVDAADALTSAGHADRAAGLLAEQLALVPDDAPPTWRPLMLAARAAALAVIETEEDPVAISEEAVRLLPDDDDLIRARVVGNHARILAVFRRHEEAQRHGLDALALAEKLNRKQLASDIVTTLSGLRLGRSSDRLRAALRDAVEQSVASGAVHAELRGRYLLARSYQDWAEFDESEEWFRSAVDRAQEAGIEWAPFAFESRWHLTWVMLTRGDWDQVLALTDVADSHPPPTPRAMFATLRSIVRVARGEDVSAELTALRPMWRVDGALALHAAAQEIALATRAGDAHAALATYDALVTSISAIWHPWFDGRVRLAAETLEALAAAMPRVAAADRPPLLEAADRLHGDGHTVVERYADPAAQWGPEGHAWLARLDAELLRVRWLAGADDAPTLDALRAGWRDVVDGFEAFGDVYELARARTALAGVLRATGDAAGAREAADLARVTARALGAKALLDQLRSIGSTTVRHEPGGDALTPRETEILALVADGRSNGEIGKQLFISTKTVSVHVSNILGKLGAAGRTEAAAIARRRGLLD